MSDYFTLHRKCLLGKAILMRSINFYYGDTALVKFRAATKQNSKSGVPVYRSHLWAIGRALLESASTDCQTGPLESRGNSARRSSTATNSDLTSKQVPLANRVGRLLISRKPVWASSYSLQLLLIHFTPLLGCSSMIIAPKTEAIDWVVADRVSPDRVL